MRGLTGRKQDITHPPHAPASIHALMSTPIKAVTRQASNKRGKCAQARQERPRAPKQRARWMYTCLSPILSFAGMALMKASRLPDFLARTAVCHDRFHPGGISALRKKNRPPCPVFRTVSVHSIQAEAEQPALTQGSSRAREQYRHPASEGLAKYSLSLPHGVQGG